MRRLLYSPIRIFRFFPRPFQTVLMDADRWCEVLSLPERGMEALLQQFRKPEFRTLFYHRFIHAGGPAKKLALLFRIFYRPQVALYLPCPDIGPGFYIQHGFATAVNAHHIGRNCWVSQQVTVGHGGTGEKPILEDGVRVYAGAKVIGNIVIGANARIGANAVVVKDVPPNCTVVGVPGRIVKRDGVRVDEPL